VDVEKAQHWNSRGHFFAAAAEAMRRILVENARRKGRVKHGGEMHRLELNEAHVASEQREEEAVAVSDVLDRLAEVDSASAQLVKLHYFAGLTIEQAAEMMGISVRTAHRNWAFARAWIFRQFAAGQ
jgi:RNA polymerase sigma factor (TIGR02999 family)